MSNIDDEIAIQPLDKLKKRINPVPFKRVMLNITNNTNAVIEEGTDIVADTDENPGPALNIKKNIIVDRTKDSNIDRLAIINRLRNKLGVMVIDNSDKSDKKVKEPVKQIMPARKLVIRPPKDIQEEKEEGDEKEIEKETEALIAEQSVIEVAEPKKPGRKRKLKLVPAEMDTTQVDLTKEIIRSQAVADRLPKEREKIIVKAPSYYMNNRKIFIQKLTELFKPYQKELMENNANISCEDRGASSEFALLTHQKVVRDYLNLYTPYRGLLLYHGLGSGKTCTSIAIAEGMKTNKRVFVMTPASLKMNFFSEMKKCGDDLYKKNQYWEYVSIDGKPEYIPSLSKALTLSTNYIREHGGAWLVNINKESNYEELDASEQESLDEQLNEMIRGKYTDINYNGLNANKMKALTGNYSHNPFDNSVILIDEAHNFVSRIVNKVKNKTNTSISYRLYDYIMSANNAKVVLLTGTPIINYPNEIGILYNLLRGYITTWTIPIEQKTGKINTDIIVNMLDDENMKTFDLVEYSDNKITITRNPFGFVNTKKRGVAKGTKKQVRGGARKTKSKQPKQSKRKSKKIHFAERLELDELNLNKNERIGSSEGNLALDDRMEGGEHALAKYNGVKLDDTGNITNTDFLNNIIRILKKNGIGVKEQQIKIVNNKALPDDSNAFLSTFVDVETGNATNMNLFQRRILGLTSYFRSAQEELLPSYEKTEEGDIYHIEKTEMTDHQFAIYEKIRKVESDRESKTKKAAQMKKPGDDLFTVSSTYRIFSRAACNFTFPESIERPIPNIKEDKEVDEEILDMTEESKEGNGLDKEIDDKNAEEVEDEGSIEPKEEAQYMKRIEAAMDALNVNKEDSNEKEFLSKTSLSKYSPKFANILENITNTDNVGLHLLYSHFRTMEGIGILRLILLANGFAEFKINRTDGSWELIETDEDKGKPKFVLYTGTETAEEKEIIRNVYNSMWEYVPSSIVNKLREVNDNNNMGEIIKLFMITASGAEGINLRNTRYVHIVEPYWHMVRVEQVVGRARRICSHQDLPEELRTVKVFLYIATLSPTQKKDEKHIELLIRDTSKIDKKTPITTDENLYETSSIKQRINNQILNAVKESAIDCNLYANSAKKSGEPLVCYGFGKVESNQFSSYPVFDKDQQDKGGLDVKKVSWKGVKMTENGVDYVLNPKTNDVYDFNSYQRAKELGTELLLVGKLVKEKGKTRLEKN
tara:strand:- start:2684 stop:6331 length:3648 start_codon:yes stop_codon:yes gene_type:complete